MNTANSATAELERIEESKQLIEQGWHVAERVEKIKPPPERKAPPSAKPSIAIKASTAPQQAVPGKPDEHVEVDILASRTDKGNLVIDGEAWAIRDGLRLFGGRFERVVAQEVAPQQLKNMWQAGPAVSFSSQGWMFGAAVSPPVLRAWGFEARGVLSATTNGKSLQGQAALLIGAP